MKNTMFFTQRDNGLWAWNISDAEGLRPISRELTTTKMWCISITFQLTPWYRVFRANRAKYKRIRNSFRKEQIS